MPRVLIIADDLTGAADSGVGFAECGMEAMVLLGGREEDDADPAGWPGADALAIDAGTRYLGPRQAAETVARLVDGYDRLGAGPGLLFKKVDSTLRGNVAAELAAALQARRALVSGRPVILFAPAFPAHGRTTVNGRQMVHGRPLEYTHSGAPASSPDVAPGSRPANGPPGEIENLLGGAGLSCGRLELARIRSDAGALKSAMLRMADDSDVLVCDAETEDDLKAIANAGMALGEGTVWAGSAGLARHIPGAAGFARSFDTPRIPTVIANGPILFVVGSAATASQEQARALSSAPGMGCFGIAEAQPAATAMASRLALGEDVLLQFNSSHPRIAEHGREWLADAIRPCARHAGALVATGGETARAILDAWGIDRLLLLGEVEPGLPYSMTPRGLLVLTKAGGFGGPDTLLRCREFIHHRACKPK